jgi:hypothetical protein
MTDERQNLLLSLITGSLVAPTRRRNERRRMKQMGYLLVRFFVRPVRATENSDE